MECLKCQAEVSETHRHCPSCGTEIPVRQNSIASFAAEAKPIEYAGFWLRFGAYAVDQVLAFLCAALVSIIMTTYVIYLAGSYQSLGFEEILGILLVTELLYHALFETSVRQATPGKMLFGIKVTDFHGKRVNFLTSLARNAAKLFTGIFTPLYLYIAFDSKKQALHDKIAECLVIHR